MEVERDKTLVTVRYRGKNYTAEVPGDATVGLLGRQVSQLTGVELHTMRLLVPKGRAAPAAPLLPASEPHSSQPIKSSGISPDVVLRVIGATFKEILEVNQPVEDDRVLVSEEEQRRLQPQPDTRMFRSYALPTGPYTFQNFRLLMFPFLELNPPADKARDLMFRLRRDPGIMAIMNKYKWMVRNLSELAPERLVGVSPQCVPGFNKNRGEDISMQLRTDDLQGFRKYASIKKTLLHELAHMVHDEHDENFHALEKQLNQEALQHSAEPDLGESTSKSSFHPVSVDQDSETSRGFQEPHPDDMLMNKETVCQPLPEKSMGFTEPDPDESVHSEEPDPDESVHSEEPDSDESVHSDEIEKIGGANFYAMTRLVWAVHRLMQLATPTETTAAFQTLSTILSYCLNYPNDRSYKVLSKGNPRFHNLVGRFEAAVEFLRAVGFSDIEVGGDNILVFPEADRELLRLALGVLDDVLHDSMAVEEPGLEEFMHPEEPDPDEIGRIQDTAFAARALAVRARLQRAIDSLMQQATPAEAIAAIKKLAAILSIRLNYMNASEHVILVLGHPDFHNPIGRFEAAVEFLRIVGFLDEVIDGSSKLVSREADPGLIWLALSVLHRLLAQH